MDKKWSKGHVRLACAYIANHQSNDACNSLQRAIQLDSSNSTLARQLLREQLVQRNTTPSAPPMEDTLQHHPPQPSAPPMEQQQETRLPTAGFYTTNNNTSSFPTSSSSYETTNHPNDTVPTNEREEYNNNNHDNNTTSWLETIQIKVSNIMTYLTMKLHDTYTYYQNLSPDGKTVVQVLIGFVFIYIAFGGRFGLTTTTTSSSSNHHYHPHTSSQYSSNQQQQQRYSYERSRNNPQYHTNNNYHDNDSYQQQQQRSNDNYYYSSSSYQFHLFDGSLPSMILLAIIGYVCHAFLGINPAHAIYMLRLLTSPRRGAFRRRHHGFGGHFNPAGYRRPNMFRR